MNQLNSDYVPVSCDLSDELELLSMRKQKVELKVNVDSGSVDYKLGLIQDLFTKDHADFLKLSDGSVIRLDKIMEWRKTA